MIGAKSGGSSAMLSDMSRLSGRALPELAGRAQAAVELARGLTATWSRRIARKRETGEWQQVVDAMAADPDHALEKLAGLIQAELNAGVELIFASAEAWRAEALRCEGELRALRRYVVPARIVDERESESIPDRRCQRDVATASAERAG